MKEPTMRPASVSHARQKRGCEKMFNHFFTAFFCIYQLFIIVNRFQCHRQIVIHTFAQNELAHIQHAGAEA